jgi:acyl carrier protein
VNAENDRLSRTIAQVFDVSTDEISDDSSPETISSWDSFGHLDLVMALESEFRVDISADDALAMRNVGLIRAVLRKAGAEL